MSDSQRRDEFVALLTEHRNQLYSFIYALTLNADETDDVFQQMCLVLWTKFGDYQSGTNFPAWASQIARFKVSELRRAKGRQHLSLSESLLETLADELVSQDAVHEELRTEALAVCMRKLRERDQQLVRRCYVEDIRVAELADEMGRSETSVHNSLRRIRSNLLDCIVRELSQDHGS